MRSVEADREPAGAPGASPVDSPEPDEELPHGAADGSDESFENALPVTDAPPRAPAVESEGAPPALDEILARVPPGARQALDELFKAKFTGVRRLPREQLR